MYLIFDKKDKEVIVTKDYEVYQNQLESLGSHSDCNYFHMMSVNKDELNEFTTKTKFKSYVKVYL